MVAVPRRCVIELSMQIRLDGLGNVPRPMAGMHIGRPGPRPLREDKQIPYPLCCGIDLNPESSFGCMPAAACPDDGKLRSIERRHAMNDNVLG
jgi:hypothetical protein